MLILPKVSVIIAIYNAEKYLRQCLDSVLTQTLKDIEVICVNDGSTDNSLGILQEYSKKDNRVIIINQKNQGAGMARNNGMHCAKGEFLSFLDADDFFEDNMLEEAYRSARVADSDICVFAADLYVQSEDCYKPCTWSFRKQYFPLDEAFDPKQEAYRENIFRMYNGWAWDKLFRKRFIDDIGIEFQNLRTTNDMFFVFIALAKANRVVAIDNILVHQRVEVATSLSKNREKSWDCFYIALLAMKEELEKSLLYEIYNRAFVNWALNFSLWQLNTMKGDSYKKTYELLRQIGFARLDIAKKPKSYFFVESEYDQFIQILTHPLNEKIGE